MPINQLYILKWLMRVRSFHLLSPNEVMDTSRVAVFALLNLDSNENGQGTP